MAKTSVNGAAISCGPPPGFDLHDWSQNGQSIELPLDSFVAGDPAKRKIVAPYLGLMNEAYWQKVAESDRGGAAASDASLRFAISEAVYRLAAPKRSQDEESLFEKLYELFIAPDAHAEPVTVTITVTTILKIVGPLIIGACLVSKPAGPWDEDGDGFKSDNDCNDGNPNINPNAGDTTCDGIDQNCDGFDGPRRNSCDTLHRDGSSGADTGGSEPPLTDDGGYRNDGEPGGDVYNDTARSDALASYDGSPPDAGVADSADAAPPPDAAGTPDGSSDAGPAPDTGILDGDGDLVPDELDNCITVPNREQSDFNSDGVGDVCEDSDLDGLDDADELRIGTSPLNPDSDSDTILDNNEIGGNIRIPLDSDFDTIVNALDSDDDGDGVATIVEANFRMNHLDGDSDGDGLGDLFETGSDPANPVDTDRDGNVNANDPDSDNDGVNDGTDNCRLTENADQLNTDGDLHGDACDDDASRGNFSAVAASGVHTCALLNDTSVQCWGSNDHGQLGDGTTEDRLSPTLVPGLTGVRQIELGDRHTCALLNDTSIQCWGWNGNGQLGDDTIIDRFSPTPVLGLAGVEQIELGSLHTCALLDDTTVRCWGYNNFGQLGDNTNTDHHLPMPVLGLTGVAEIGLGGHQTCAALADNTVECWGRNNYGQLGDDSTASRYLPTPVPGLTDVEHIRLGGDHTCSLLADNTVKCWGLNNHGQLGNGRTEDRHSPTLIPEFTGVEQIELGALHSCALLDDTTVRCWGYNGSGQLGSGAPTDRSFPTTVPDLTDARQLGLGLTYTCAVFVDDTLRCWGDNSYGR